MFQGIRSSGSLSAEAVSNIKEYGRPLAALFSLRPHSFLLRRKGIAAASEEASSIPFPPGRRKLHIRSLLLPSQIVTVSLGHNLAIWNFTTPHAILMMAVISLPANTAKSKTSMRRKSRARLWSIEGVRGNHPKGFPGRLFLFLAARHGSFLYPNRERKEWGRKIRFLF